ncbi:MAG TPA: RusA family crossover junction endodeoxyribonuclease [Myxococcales bacterium]|nr:RusA family crossover junction endodeoxyribonuclease [Myxococcales bacterium]
MKWTCTIPLEPMGKQRPRLAKAGKFARAYTPAKTAQWERDAAIVLQAHWRRPALDGAVRVTIRAYRKRSQYMSAKCRQHLTICTSKPDVDNVAKICLDSLVKARVLADDNLVVELVALKRWAAVGEPGRVEVDIDTAIE